MTMCMNQNNYPMNQNNYHKKLKWHLYVCWGLEGDIKVRERERKRERAFIISIELELSKSPWLSSQASSAVSQSAPSRKNTTVMCVSLVIGRYIMGKYQRIISRSKACGIHLHVFQRQGLKEFSTWLSCYW
jgi:hypothetical protein